MHVKNINNLANNVTFSYIKRRKNIHNDLTSASLR